MSQLKIVSFRMDDGQLQKLDEVAARHPYADRSMLIRAVVYNFLDDLSLENQFDIISKYLCL